MNIEINEETMKKAGIVVAILFLLYLVIHHFTKSSGPVLPVPKVQVQQPKVKEIVDYVTQTGTLVAFNSVDLVARVEGYLEKIEFTDGTYLEKDKEVFVIQPKPYLEQLKAAQANVAAAKANYEYATAEYARQQRMYKDHATSLNNVEVWKAKKDEAQAEVDKSMANEEIAKINYGYTHVSTPFAGRIGRHLVDAGNLVGNGVATDLATIQQIDPLYVYFNLNELDLIKLREAAKKNDYKQSNLTQIPIFVSLQNERDFKHKGHLDFVNTGLNAATGTMELRGVLDNKDHFFVPGLFVQVRVPIDKPKKQLTVPNTALLYDQIGPYLLVADKDDKVVLTRVTLGADDQGDRAITKGLKPNDRVIVNGIQNATPGNQVQILEPEPQEKKSA